MKNLALRALAVGIVFVTLSPCLRADGGGPVPLPRPPAPPAAR